MITEADRKIYDETKAYLHFQADAVKAKGKIVIVRWTNCGNAYQGRGIIIAINRKSVSVRLTDSIPGYAAGRCINAPLFGLNQSWSVNNGFFPVGE